MFKILEKNKYYSNVEQKLVETDNSTCPMSFLTWFSSMTVAWAVSSSSAARIAFGLIAAAADRPDRGPLPLGSSSDSLARFTAG